MHIVAKFNVMVMELQYIHGYTAFSIIMIISCVHFLLQLLHY